MKHALVVRGGWQGHDPVGTTDHFLPLLRDRGFTVTVHEGAEVYEDREVMSSVDLILQCVTMGTITDGAVDNLRTAVARGAGLAGWHGGIVDSFRGSTAYAQLVGGQFLAHPPLEGTDGSEASHYLVPHLLTPTGLGASHPITAGSGQIRLATENYWMACDGYCDVLMTTTVEATDQTPWHRPVASPAVWTRAWGQGRVFVATPGHDLATLTRTGVGEIIAKGLIWAAGDE